MSDTLRAATALNGEIVVGDKVAVAVNNSYGLRLGTVLAFRERQRWPGGIEVQVSVTKSSGGTGYTYKLEEVDGERKYVQHERPYTKWYPARHIAKAA